MAKKSKYVQNEKIRIGNKKALKRPKYVENATNCQKFEYGNECPNKTPKIQKKCPKIAQKVPKHAKNCKKIIRKCYNMKQNQQKYGKNATNTKKS